MPKKYHINPKPTPPRFPPVGKHSTVDWREDCIGCRKCVKKVACIYDTYDKNTSFIQKMKTAEYLYICKNCLRCVQGCTKGLLSMAVNPEYNNLGDSYWTPDLIFSTWYQAETGKIPVSGAGYRGPFSGPGFDSMWTDMSEIVRPTRDGIHGREYISTAVDLGGKLESLEFDENGALISDASSLISIPLPLIFNLLPFGDLSENVLLGMAQAAAKVDTIMQIMAEDYFDALSPYLDRLMPVFTKESLSEYKNLIGSVRIAEFIYADDIIEYVRQAKKLNPEIIISIRLPLSPSADFIVEELAEEGTEIIHLHADSNGKVEISPLALLPRNSELEKTHSEFRIPNSEFEKPSSPFAQEPRFIKDTLRGIHCRLVENSLRDSVTIIASGGIAEASHLAKVIICGADLAAIDLPLLIALECRLCKNCLRSSVTSPDTEKELPCPVEIHNVEPEYASARIINLISAWHSQLIEVLGAMGLREVRRLRGEVGRAMFFEDLERDTFEQIFCTCPE